MSSDKKFLKALSVLTKSDLRHFEIVSVERGDRALGFRGNVKRVIVAVGKHALWLVKRNANLVLPGGELKYEWVERVIEDSASNCKFEVRLSDKRSADCPYRITVLSESRTSLLTSFATCYIADGMLRLGKVVVFPKEQANLGADKAECPCITPFNNYVLQRYQDYTFFLHETFKDLPNAVARTKTGSFKAPTPMIHNQSSPSGGVLTLSVLIHKPVPIKKLTKIGREHIRWVALEYKEALIRNQHTYVIRNQLYLKKMNLSNDISAWICWEMLLRAKDVTTMMILMRRQYLPPLLDTAQDFVIILKCPTDEIDKQWTSEARLMHEAHIIADSFGPEVQNPGLYPEMIQAKLDALLYDEEAYGWIKSRLKLEPAGEGNLSVYAWVFLRGVLKILRDDNALKAPPLWEEVRVRVNMLIERKSELDLDPMELASKGFLAKCLGWSHLPDTSPDVVKSLNAWQSRVAGYLSFAIDGGMLGSKFTLHDIVSTLGKDMLTQEAERKLSLLVAFLLHLRDKDFRKPFTKMSIINQLISFNMLGGQSDVDVDGSTQNCTFNDRNMQVLLELEYLKRTLSPSNPDKISVEYAELLKNLMLSDSSSVNLKASICRQIISMKDSDEQGTILIPGLISLMTSGGLFLATYSTAAVVNLSQSKDNVKNFLMRSQIAEICIAQLKSKDDDLILYTLMLLVHLTKMVHHRQRLMSVNIVAVLMDILTASYDVVKYKRRILTELAAVIGQMCNDEETRKLMCDNYPVIELLIHDFDQTLPQPACKLMSKILFAFKQLCANSQENKDTVGPRVIKQVVKALSHPTNLENQDWATNAITLLVLMSISRSNCQLIQDDWPEAYRALHASPLGSMDVTRDRIEQIRAAVSNDK